MSFGNFFDDVLGMDPNGKGSAGLWNGLLGITGGTGIGMLDNRYLGDYVAELKKQQDAARAKNEERYGEILGNLRGNLRQTKREGRANVQYLRGQRKEQLQQNAERFNNLGTQVNQDLVSRGLTNTTIKPTMEMGIEGERRRAATDINNTVNRGILGQRQYNQGRVDLARSAITGFKERREDAYPDLSGLQSLASAYGSAQGADRARLAAQLQGAFAGLGGPFGQQQGGQYSGQTLPWNPYPSGQMQQPQQQSGGLLGGLLKLLPGIGGLF